VTGPAAGLMRGGSWWSIATCEHEPATDRLSLAYVLRGEARRDLPVTRYACDFESDRMRAAGRRTHTTVSHDLASGFAARAVHLNAAPLLRLQAGVVSTARPRP
jgi:hypothetical protein